MEQRGRRGCLYYYEHIPGDLQLVTLHFTDLNKKFLETDTTV